MHDPNSKTSAVEPIACSIRDGASALGISPATLRRQYIQTGRLTVFKSGNRSLIKVQQLKDIAAQLPEAGQSR